VTELSDLIREHRQRLESGEFGAFREWEAWIKTLPAEAVQAIRDHERDCSAQIRREAQRLAA